jgi:hypothetical protein
MLAVNGAIMIGVFLYKTRFPPYVPYIHLLVDYHFGFTKRALIGALVGLFTARVPVWPVFAIGGAIWLITFVLFVRLFLNVFAFSEKHPPLFVFMAASPFFFKNFLHTLGHFDIYGCAVAICLLLAAAGSIFFVLLAALLSGILILIHHIHIVMYVPTIAVIVLLRHHLIEGAARGCIVVEVLAALALAALFVAVQFGGTMHVPAEEFASNPQSKMINPSDATALAFSYIWYQPLSKEISDTWRACPGISGAFPLCAPDLAARAAVALLCLLDQRAARGLATADRRRRAYCRDVGLSRDVRHHLRLFPLGVELGGVHVPDPARGQDAAGNARGDADFDRGRDDAKARLDRDSDPVRRHRATLLGLGFID